VLGSVTIGTVTLTSPAQVVASTIAGAVSIPAHLLRAGAVALAATILGAVTIPTPTFTSGYVEPGDPIVTGEPATASIGGGDAGPVVLGDPLPPVVSTSGITAGVI
jgi:hypothetical protein